MYTFINEQSCSIGWSTNSSGALRRRRIDALVQQWSQLLFASGSQAGFRKYCSALAKLATARLQHVPVHNVSRCSRPTYVLWRTNAAMLMIWITHAARRALGDS